MRGCLFRMLVVCGLTLLTLGGCSSPLRQPYPTDKPPAIFEGFKDIRYYPSEYGTLAQTNLEAAYANVGVNRDKLHVDGGVFAQSFFIGNLIDTKQLVTRAHPEWDIACKVQGQ